MKITSVESVIVKVPIRHSITLGVGGLDFVENVLVWITTEDGVTGVGESSPWPVFAETAGGCKVIIDQYLAPLIMGEDSDNIEALVAKMDAGVKGHPFAKCGVEMALWDHKGKELGQPLYKLLGGKCRDKISISFSVSGQKTEEDVKEVQWLLEQGIRKFKIKTGVLPLDQEVKRLEAISKVLTPDAQLRLDFNQGLKRDEAMKACSVLEQFNPFYMEQPVPQWDIDSMAMIANNIDTPISADESVFSIHDALRVVSAGACDIVSIKIAKHGGIIGGKKVAAICEAAGINCFAGAMWESGIGIAASMHLTASTPNIVYGSDYYIPKFLMVDDLVKAPLPVKDGYFYVPEGPGLGVEVDMDAVEKYRVS